MDGATTWQQFVRITLPMVKPTLVVAVLFRTLDTLRMFDLPYGMIGAGKYRVETLSIFAYQEATQTRYGPAAAYAIVLFIYVLLVAFLFVRILGADVIGDSGMPKKKKKKGKDDEPAPGSGAALETDGRCALMATATALRLRPSRTSLLRRSPSSPTRSRPTRATDRNDRLLRRHGTDRPLLHHPVLLDDRLLVATPDRGPQHRVHPEPGRRSRTTRACSRHSNNFGRSLINSLIVAGTTTILDPAVRHRRRVRPGPAELPGQGWGALADHGLLDVPADHPDPAAAEDVLLDIARSLVPVLDEHLSGRHRPRAELRPAAGGVEPDGLLQADAGRAGAGGHGRRLHARRWPSAR